MKADCLIFVCTAALAMFVQGNPGGCPNVSVRHNSYCNTSGMMCGPLVEGACFGNGDKIETGDFQCDEIYQGYFCQGSGTMALCYRRAPCIPGLLENGQPGCVPDLNGPNCQAFQQETKVSKPCPSPR